MSRLHFLGFPFALWAWLTLLCAPAPAALTIIVQGPASFGGGTLTCTLSTEFQTTINDQYSSNTGSGDNTSQKVRSLSGASICKVVITFETGAGVNVTCRIRDAVNAGGTAYGSAETVVTTGGTTALAFVFATKPAPPGDFYITLTADANIALAVNASGDYQSGYHVFTNTTGHTWGWKFEVWTMQ